MSSVRSDDKAHSGWQAPTVSKVMIGAATRSPAAADAPEAQHPQPPAEPASKLGFSFEMAFPLSARVEH